MRTRLLLCLVILLSCVKRINPDPGGARTAYAGTPLPFGESQQVPEGTQILWDFGDGTPQEQGASVVHAFARAGVYTVVETIRDKDGQMRTARTHVTALERTVAMAVPGDARAALLIPTPWARLPIHREVAAKLSLGASLDDLARSIGDGAGFDVLDARAAEANGFDPQKGVAFFTVPQDAEALVFAIGSSDEKKSLAAARRLLGSGRALGRYGGGPFQLADATLSDGTPILVGRNAGGETIAVLQRQGYLYLRLAGATDPALALGSAAAIPPGKGLAADPGFLTAIRHVGSGDAVFYSRGGDRGAAGSGRLSGELGASAFAVLERPENRDFVQ
ncbi:MAG TPA: PKD domain-containing protein, partial [Myxococcales bacterium]|nr:PKD domain-containing protein [Myxococcales bacterium]